MQRLSFALFIDAQKDMESAQLRILAALKEIHNHFQHNCIYPDLSDVMEIHDNVLDVFRRSKKMDESLPRTLTGVDLRNISLIYSLNTKPEATLESIKELLQWSIPYLEKALEEGKTIYDFVDEHCEVQPVGIIPAYLDEGYFLVPDIEQSLLAVFRYQVTVFTGAEDKYRALRTRLIDVLPLHTVQSDLRSLKLELIRQYPDLPNPAVYSCETDMDFPFSETLFPVAKRKLMMSIAQGTIH